MLFISLKTHFIIRAILANRAFFFFKKRYTKYVSKIFYLMFLVFCFSFWYNTILDELVYLQNNRLSNYHFPTRCCSSGSKITGVLNPATRGGKRDYVFFLILLFCSERCKARRSTVRIIIYYFHGTSPPMSKSP